MFKIVMGYIYLTIFIGVFTWKLWVTLGKQEDGPLLFTLVILLILGIVLMVRKKLFENY